MADNVVQFHPAPRTDVTGAPSGERVRPTVSLPLILRFAPPELQPEAVALALLATGSNANAAPIWTSRRAAFRKLLSGRSLPVARQRVLEKQWIAHVRAAGLQEKARRRAKVDAFWRTLMSGANPEPDSRPCPDPRA